MKRGLLSFLFTVAVFSAGLVTGIWIHRTQPFPPPPIGLMGEIRDLPLTGGQPLSPPSEPKNDVPVLKAELERMKPEIEAFRTKLEPIKTEFRQNLDALLTPEQRAQLKAIGERPVRWAGMSNPPFSSDPSGRPARLRSHEGLDSIFPIVIVSNTLERLTAELKLSDEQVAATRSLLLTRRAKFLALVDSSPPPSLRLGRIAPLVPQMAAPPAK